MRRRRIGVGNPTPNLDSFLDILTNTVGVLVFVLLFVSLSAADATVLMHTPLWTKTSKNGALFEVRGDRVIYIDTDKATNDFRQLLQSVPPINIFNFEAITRRIERFATTTDNYRVTFIGALGAGMGLNYQIRGPEVGTPVRALKEDTAEYLRIVSRLSSESDYVGFIVRPDGIETFRVARDLAAKKGLATGWEPLVAGGELTFGSGGRAIGVQ